MNSCLADLSRLIPPQYMRKGRGRVEKTEIIEMAIRHLKNLQNQECIQEQTYGEYYRSGYIKLKIAHKYILKVICFIEGTTTVLQKLLNFCCGSAMKICIIR